MIEALLGNAGILLTRVLYRKQGGEKKFVIVDAGMNDLIRPTLYEAYHHICPVKPDAKNLNADRRKDFELVGGETVSANIRWGNPLAISADMPLQLILWGYRYHAAA